MFIIFTNILLLMLLHVYVQFETGTVRHCLTNTAICLAHAYSSITAATFHCTDSSVRLGTVSLNNNAYTININSKHYLLTHWRLKLCSPCVCEYNARPLATSFWYNFMCCAKYGVRFKIRYHPTTTTTGLATETNIDQLVS